MDASSSTKSFGKSLAPDRHGARPKAIDWNEYVGEVTRQWKELLDREPEEREVQQFLELHPSMVPGGSGEVGPGGHHGSELSAVFRLPELKGLGPNYFPDFMWVTRSSALITPILIEIEKPSKKWFRKDGRPTAEFTHAHDQLTEWRSWFARPGNLETFRQTYLFSDSFRSRPLVPQYVLVYGRASEFEPCGPHSDPETLRHKRDLQRHADESFISFDSLRPRYDSAATLTATMTAHGPRAFALSPLYGTSSNSGKDAMILGSLHEALERSAMLSPERKVYLAQRWDHWKETERRIDADRSNIHPRGSGLE